MLENIRLSFQGIWSHKMRSFLTMLGIIIGIASIISIVSTIKGTQEQIKKNLIGAGNNTVAVPLKQGESEYETEYMGLPQGISTVTDEQMEDIRSLDEVKAASRYLSRNYADSVYYQNTSLDGAKVFGIESDYLSTCGYQIKKGRNFVPYDTSISNKVVMLDDVAAQSLFQGEDPIGKTIEIKAEPFTVVGIVEKKEQFEPVINSMEDYYTYSSSDTGSLFMPIATWPVVYYYDEPQNVVVMAADTEQMSSAGKKTADILNANVTNSDGDIKYKATDTLETAKNLQALSESTNMQLLWIASISLLVGGIGVMNIMLVSVTERTSEIGLKKAIGARKRKIMVQFLTEAAVLTSIGGILGAVSGVILSQVISKVSQTPTAVSVPAIIGSVAFSMVIGIIFGLLPSYKAANLNPIDALRYE
ncbi:MAG: ABC transporter permease [Lachnospiraceae bacterium]|nr:ABC transporter permease [Lachnospiraceae bacterium]